MQDMPIGTIKSLQEDERGLRVRARLLNTWMVEPVREAIKEGAITGMSFRFTPVEEAWSSDGSKRTLKAVQLHELGPVVFPAYRTTSVSVRSADDPVLQLVELIKADPDVRSSLASALTFGGTEPLADDGGELELADGNEVREDSEPVTELPDNLRQKWLDRADHMERLVLLRERGRLV